LRFAKLHGLGNDYIYVNGFEHTLDNPVAAAKRWSDRHFGIGGDGLILVLPPEPGVEADLRMRMFNADGSESEMCGNGVRGLCKFAIDRGLADANPLLVQTGAGVLSLAHFAGPDGRVELVEVDMGRPERAASRVPVDVPGFTGDAEMFDQPIRGLLPPLEADASVAGWSDRAGLDPRLSCVALGNPHAILFCDRPEAVPLEQIGPLIEHAPIFPNRVNVHFVRVDGPRELTMRTWERGSGITLACGTGASAVCVAAARTGRAERDVVAHLPGGDLQLVWRDEDDHVRMTGPAVEVFHGEISA